MASREERFARRIRGAGARALAADDDEFGIALPGLSVGKSPAASTAAAALAAVEAPATEAPAPAATPEVPTQAGTAAQRAAKAVKEKKKKRASRSRASAVQPQQQQQAEDQEGHSASNDAEAGPGETGASNTTGAHAVARGSKSLEDEDETPSGAATDHVDTEEIPLTSKTTSAGSKRRKERSLRQQSLSKKQPSPSVNGFAALEEEEEEKMPQEAEPTADAASYNGIQTEESQANEIIEETTLMESESQQLPVALEASLISEAFRSSEKVQDQAQSESGPEAQELTGNIDESMPDIASEDEAHPEISRPQAKVKRKRRASINLPKKNNKKSLHVDQTVGTENVVQQPRRPRGRPPKKALVSTAAAARQPLPAVSEGEEAERSAEPARRGEGRKLVKDMMPSRPTTAGSYASSVNTGKHKKNTGVDTIDEAELQQRPNSVPIITYTLKNPQSLRLPLRAGEQPSSRLPPLIDTEQPQKPTPTAPDVLAQVSNEIVQATLAKIASNEGESRAEKAALRRMHDAVQAFGGELQQRLREMSQLVSSNAIWSRRIKHAKRAKKELMDEIVQARKERNDVDDRWLTFTARQDVATKVRLEDEQITSLLEGVKSAVRHGRAIGNASEKMVGAEFDLRTVGDRISGSDSGRGLHDKNDGVNGILDTIVTRRPTQRISMN